MQAAACSCDRIVVSTLRCGRSNPGSNPGHSNSVSGVPLPQIKSAMRTRFFYNAYIPETHSLLAFLPAKAEFLLMFDHTALHASVLVGTVCRYVLFFPVATNQPTRP